MLATLDARDDIVTTATLDAERAQLFDLLGALLSAAPDAALLDRLRDLRGAPSPLGTALIGLGDAARATTPERVAGEYFRLFVGVGRGEVLPYASWYLTGFLHERPLAAVRGDLAPLGIGRAPGVFEPEDHLGFLCEAIGGLLAGRFAGGPVTAARLFERHVAPWAERCFADIEGAAGAEFYRAVGRLGLVVTTIEMQAAALPS